MRKLVLSIAAAAVVFTAAPALAQGIYVGPGGFSVGVGPHGYYRDRDYPPGWYRGHHYGWYHHRRFHGWDYD